MTATNVEGRQQLLEVVCDLLRSRAAPDVASAAIQRIEDHLDGAGDYLLRGVNPPRADRDPAWDEARGGAYFETERTGAVHLELGTFTTFPESRVKELIAGDELSEFIRLDFDREYAPDLVADVTALPMANASVDRVASNSLFEHVAYPHKVIEETFRILRPGGVMEVAMPFVWKRHGYPHDYVRLTPQFFERVCRETGFVDIVVDEDGCSGLYNTMHNASKMAAVTHGTPETDAARAIHEAVIVLLGALIPLDRAFEDSSRQWFHSVRVVARKPGAYQPSQRPRDTTRPLIERIVDLLADPVAKAPLIYDGGRLVCEFTGMSYAVKNNIAIFTEPVQSARPSEPLGDRVRRGAATVKHRLG